MGINPSLHNRGRSHHPHTLCRIIFCLFPSIFAVLDHILSYSFTLMLYTHSCPSSLLKIIMVWLGSPYSRMLLAYSSVPHRLLTTQFSMPILSSASLWCLSAGYGSVSGKGWPSDGNNSDWRKEGLEVFQG